MFEITKKNKKTTVIPVHHLGTCKYFSSTKETNKQTVGFIYFSLVVIFFFQISHLDSTSLPRSTQSSELVFCSSNSPNKLSTDVSSLFVCFYLLSPVWRRYRQALYSKLKNEYSLSPLLSQKAKVSDEKNGLKGDVTDVALVGECRRARLLPGSTDVYKTDEAHSSTY